MENIVEKGEIAHFEQFHLFPQCFPKAVFFNVLKRVYMEERVNYVSLFPPPPPPTHTHTKKVNVLCSRRRDFMHLFDTL